MRTLSAALLLFLCVASVPAYEYNAATGYWYYGGQAYSRWWQPAYTSYGHYYPGYYFYQPVYTAQTNVTVNLPGPGDVNWRGKLLDVVKNRDDNRAYQDALNALGIAPPTGGLSTSPYLGGHGYGYSNSYQIGSYGVSGQSLYGYNQSALTALYGSYDANVLYQQAARLAERAQDLGGQATTNFQELIAADADGRNKTAQVLARGLAAATALQGAQGTGSNVTQVQQGQGAVVPPPPGTGKAMPPADPQLPPPQGVAQVRQQLLALKCLACHNPSRKEGGLDLSNYDGLDQATRQAVFDRAVSSDPAKAMPRRPDKSAPRPEDRLTPAELRLFLQ